MKKGVQLSYEVDVDVPLMNVGDSHRLRQILINLMSNAVKFTDEGSIEVIVKIDGAQTVIQVVDTGTGIPEDKQKSIFNAYTQSDSSISSMYGGTGLGLAISKKIANMMEGDIELKSKTGEGSTFELRVRLEELLLRSETGTQIVERWIYADSTVEDITRDVIESLPERLSQIEDKAAHQDVEGLEFYVHSLKGVTGNFNIIEIYKISQEFDEYLRNGDIDFRIVDDYIFSVNEIVKRIPNEIINHREPDLASELKGEFKILLAEDVPENQLLIKQMLRHYPVEINVVNNGVETIEALEKGSYDCLLLDIQMPILTGEDVLKWIRTVGGVKDMYVVALTANAFKEDMEKYLALGAHWFLSKPVKKEILRGKIKDLIQLKGE